MSTGRGTRFRLMQPVGLALLAACGGDASPASAPLDAGFDPGPCAVEVSAHPLLAAPHITPGAYSDAAYNSNPPSSGPHCDAWGDWRSYDRPLPRCNWIHNLEHGGVVMTWSCPDGCPGVASALTGIARAAIDGCAPARVVVTPDPSAPTRVAAAAWGWTFRASCLDAVASQALLEFVDAHIGQAPEQICAGGGAKP